MLRFAADTADPANGALMQQVQERRTAIETQLLFFDLEWAALDDERADELLAADGLDARAPLPALGPPLPPAPADRARGEDPRREVASPGRGAWTRLFDELTSRDRGRARRRDEPVAARAALAQPDVARPRACAQRGRRRSPRRSRPALRTRAFVFNTLLHDKAIDDRLRSYPSWISQPQPRQRGERRVGAGARRRGARRATTSRSAGTASRRGCSGSTGSPTTTAWRRSPPTTSRFGWDEATELVLDAYGVVLARARPTSRGAFFDERWIDAPVAARQARRRVLRLHRPVACTRTCCSTGRRAAATC